MKMRFILVFIFFLGLVVVVQGDSTVVFEDDFSTDPFAAGSERWTKETQVGSYPIIWTGGWNPSDWHGALPAENGNPLDSMYACTTGYNNMWTNDTTVRSSSYSISMDFIISGDIALSDITIGQYLQRQAGNSSYESSFACGGSGLASWTGVHVWSGYGGTALSAEVWYQLVTDVTISASEVSVQSRIVRISDSFVINTSPVYTDSSAGRYTDANGYGYKIQLPGTRYWTQAVQTDNFIVTAPSFSQDDFDVDPSERWVFESTSGFPVYWTATNPSSINGSLPTELGNPLDALYIFSDGIKEMWTKDADSRDFDYYSVSTDFTITNSDPCNSLANISVYHYVQRQAADSAQCYKTGFALGGNGQASWDGVYGWSGYGGTPLVAEEWYRLVTFVERSSTDVKITAKIIRISDGETIHTSPEYTDSSAGRFTDSKGFGIEARPGINYWSQAVILDNFEALPVVFNEDDFSEDPDGRWIKETEFGTMPFFWAYPGWDPCSLSEPSSLALPAAEPNAMYVFSQGWKRLWTKDAVVRDFNDYRFSVDFIINGEPNSVSDIIIGQYLQRQDADPAQAYEASFALGGNGQISWTGAYNAAGVYDGAPVEKGQWYTLNTEVYINELNVQMQSKVVRKSDGELVRVSDVYTDNSAGRLLDSKGFGLFVSLPGTRYWNQAVQLDNYTIAQLLAPEPYLDADISGAEGISDYYVDPYDLEEVAADWLKCTNPTEAGCVSGSDGDLKTISEVPAGFITIDGDLSEWTDAEWISLDEIYWDNPNDINSAQFAAYWESNEDVYSLDPNNPDNAGTLYVAVVVNDSDHWFDDGYILWNWSDRVEVYVQGAGGAGGSYSTTQDVAQQYIAGVDAAVTGEWAVLGADIAIPSSAGFVHKAIESSSTQLVYEMAIRVFDNFAGVTGGTSTVTELLPGKSIGFDVVADTVWGASAEGFGILSENLVSGKSANADKFEIYTLVSGTLPADIDEDYYVNLKDFARLAEQWMECNDTENENCGTN